MTKRIFIAEDRIRVSKPGFDAETAAVGNLAFWESISPVTPLEYGSVTLGAGASTTRGLTQSYNAPPFVLLKGSLNRSPSLSTMAARFSLSGNSLAIWNYAGSTQTIKYFVFRDLAFI